MIAQRKRNGREMKAHLETAGIRPQKVIRKRETDEYVADFYVPEMQLSVRSALDWSKDIHAAFPDHVRIVQLDDLRADWREGRPIIAATVTFAWKDAP